MNLYEECKEAKTIAISAHIRPDGDAIGSSMAMYLYLSKRIPDAKIDVYLNPIADYFLCIKDSDKILHEIPEDKADAIYDVFICVDCDPARMAFGHELFANAKKRINIDHHITNANGQGDVNFCEPDSASASELVYKVLDKEFLDADIALPIYIGIIHDTGVLQYSNVKPSTLNIVAELIKFDIGFPAVIQKTFYEKTYVQTQLLAQALIDTRILMGGRCASSVIYKETMDKYGADSRDLEGIVNQMRYIRGVDCAIFMYELDTNEYKVSLRTSKFVDASKVTFAFGGGGHEKAAGVTMQGTPEEITEKLIGEVQKQLNN